MYHVTMATHATSSRYDQGVAKLRGIRRALLVEAQEIRTCSRSVEIWYLTDNNRDILPLRLDNI